jgi:phage I-like protein
LLHQQEQAVPNPTHFKSTIAALVFSLADTGSYPAGCNAHITPDGAFRSDDGRPRCMDCVEVDDWQMNAEIAAGLIADMEKSGKPILYDYEHNSLYGDSRAAGWIVKLVYVAGRGLFGQVEWTPDAAEEIAKKVYRYSSPLFCFNGQTGAVTKLLSVALTNNPALGDLGAVDLARRATLANQFLTTAGGLPGNNQSGESMTPEQLAALTAERDGLKTNVAALTAERDGLKTQVVALTSERDALKTKVDAAEAEKAKVALAAEQAKHTDLLTAALTDGRLTPAQKAWAEKQSLVALTEYLDASKSLPITQMQADLSHGNGGHGLTQDELAMCSKMGVTPEDFAKAKKA